MVTSAVRPGALLLVALALNLNQSSAAQSNPTYVQFQPTAGLRPVSNDRDFVVFEGASHNIIPCTECERRQGEYNNSVKVFFDYVSRWINARF